MYYCCYYKVAVTVIVDADAIIAMYIKCSLGMPILIFFSLYFACWIINMEIAMGSVFPSLGLCISFYCISVISDTEKRIKIC